MATAFANGDVDADGRISMEELTATVPLKWIMEYYGSKSEQDPLQDFFSV